MKKTPIARHGGTDFACECGGRLRSAVLNSYDFSGYVGFPLKVLKVPGLTCAKCAGETIDGGVINIVIKLIVVEITKSPGRLSPDQARFLRRVLGATQQELSARMGIARETVAKWECGDAISPQHDLILRVIVLAPLVAAEPAFVPKAQLTDLLSRLQAVRTAPPSPLESVDLGQYDLTKRRTGWKAGSAPSGASIAATG